MGFDRVRYVGLAKNTAHLHLVGVCLQHEARAQVGRMTGRVTLWSCRRAKKYARQPSEAVASLPPPTAAVRKPITTSELRNDPHKGREHTRCKARPTRELWYSAWRCELSRFPARSRESDALATLRYMSRISISGLFAAICALSDQTMTILTVRHVTTYRYRRPISFGEHRMMFRRRDSYDQRLIDLGSHLASAGVPAPDPRCVGNCVALARFKTAPPTAVRNHDSPRSLPRNIPDFRTEPRAHDLSVLLWPRGNAGLDAPIAPEYPDPTGDLHHWVRDSCSRVTPTDGTTPTTLTYGIKESFTYARRSEHGTQDPW